MSQREAADAEFVRVVACICAAVRNENEARRDPSMAGLMKVARSCRAQAMGLLVTGLVETSR